MLVISQFNMYLYAVTRK